MDSKQDLILGVLKYGYEKQEFTLNEIKGGPIINKNRNKIFTKTLFQF